MGGGRNGKRQMQPRPTMLPRPEGARGRGAAAAPASRDLIQPPILKEMQAS